MKRFALRTTLAVIVTFYTLLLTGCVNEIILPMNSYSNLPVEILSIGDIGEENLDDDEVITTHISGDRMVYPNIDMLAEWSSDIVRGKILEERIEIISILTPTPENYLLFNEEDRQRFYLIHTVHQLEVLEVFKGDAEPGDIMEVRQMGGRIGNEELINPDIVPISVDDDLILFMYDNGSGRPLVLMTPTQGVFHFTPLAESARMRNANTSLESVLESQFNLPFTLNDLARITEAAQDQ